jgi:hypothetical protein
LAASSIPISNILKSSIVNDHLRQRPVTSGQTEFFIGDYCSGRNAEVPIFFTKEYQNLVPYSVPESTVYCIDMHTLRLENMFGQFQEEGITPNARVVYAKIETMRSHASFPIEQEQYLKRNPEEITSLDQYILSEKHFPPACFHLGIMNKDLLGYFQNYYEKDTDLKKSLQSIRDSLNQNALLIVTQPCAMYRVDNVKILRDNSFYLEELIDVDLKTGTHTLLDESTNIESFSKPNHYNFIVVSSK